MCDCAQHRELAFAEVRAELEAAAGGELDTPDVLAMEVSYLARHPGEMLAHLRAGGLVALLDGKRGEVARAGDAPAAGPGHARRVAGEPAGPPPAPRRQLPRHGAAVPGGVVNVLQEAARHVQGYQCQYCQAATVSIIAGVVIASHAAWCPVRLRLQRSRP